TPSRAGRIQAVHVKLALGFSAGAVATRTKSSTPSRLNASPALPGANVAPPTSVPSLPPRASAGLPSAAQKPTMSGQTVGPVGDGAGEAATALGVETVPAVACEDCWGAAHAPTTNPTARTPIVRR